MTTKKTEPTTASIPGKVWLNSLFALLLICAPALYTVYVNRFSISAQELKRGCEPVVVQYLNLPNNAEIKFFTSLPDGGRVRTSTRITDSTPSGIYVNTISISAFDPSRSKLWTGSCDRDRRGYTVEGRWHE